MNRRRVYKFAVAIVLFVFLGIGVWVLNTLSVKKADHFKVYDVEDVVALYDVRLIDQFNTPGRAAKVTALTSFANPVTKTLSDGSVSAIQNRHRHLTWYRLEQSSKEPNRTVFFTNQFGTQRVVIGQPEYLLVPARKLSDPNSRRPRDLDHFKCYRVETVLVPPEAHMLGLQDQFSREPEGAQLGETTLFCTPAQKQRAEHPTEDIKYPKEHLTIYTITEKRVIREIDIRDQFFRNQQQLKTSMSYALAVPTRKQRFVEHRD